MRYHALACDYDGTVAQEGVIAEKTLAALQSLLATGRKLILVTGRRLDELQTVLPEIETFQRVVAENGALLYDPSTREEKAMAPPPPENIVQALRARNVQPLAIGRAIVATCRPQENTVLEVIRDVGLELQVIFNREAVMVLPTGVNKASGLAAAAESLGMSMHELVGIGDAENDYSFLRSCECSAAVADAVEELKSHVDWVTRRPNGSGVVEVIEELIANDLEPRERGWTRQRLLLGTRDDGSEYWLVPRGPNVLISGPSGSGKSSVATALLERLADQKYQFCILDPEGDYEGLEGTVTLGRRERGPVVDEIMEVLARPQQNTVVNLLALPITERPPFFLELLPRLQDLRTRTGRPQWLVVDEAHHLFPASWEPAPAAALEQLERTLFITVHPDQVHAQALRSIGTLIVIGSNPTETLKQFCEPMEIRPPQIHRPPSDENSVLVWPISHGDVCVVKVAWSRFEHQRHSRKYATGELPPERSFYFRGPEGKLNLRAHNLQLFLQMAEGVDDETWLYHLRRGDYSAWFRAGIKDDRLAADTVLVEEQETVSAAESRGRVRQIIETYYVVSAAPPPFELPNAR
jgi:HAD superfamily hydrolase (TIGR01484 family)